VSTVSTVSTVRPVAGVSLPKIAIGLNGGIALTFLVLWLGMAARGDFWQADFTAFYTGWRLVLDGQGDRLYDFDLQTEYQGRLVPGRGGPGELLPFVWPPHFILAAPLAYLPLSIAFYLWTAIQLGLLLLLMRWLREEAIARGESGPALATVTFLAFQPLFLSFQLGQLALISLVALFGLWRALRSKRYLAAAAWLALASFKPQLALVPALFLVGAGYWRVLAYAGGIFGCGAAATTAILGWRCWPDFLRMTRFHAEQFGSYGIYPLRGHNFKMLFTAILGPERMPTVNLLTGLALLLAMASGLMLGRMARDTGGRRWHLCFALSLLLAVLSAPHLSPHDALLLVVPAVLFYNCLQGTEIKHSAAATLAACAFVLAPLFFLTDSFAMGWWPSQIRPFFIAIVGMSIWIAEELIRNRPVVASGATTGR
jgi:hypothetical protein